MTLQIDKHPKIKGLDYELKTVLRRRNLLDHCKSAGLAW